MVPSQESIYVFNMERKGRDVHSCSFLKWYWVYVLWHSSGILNYLILLLDETQNTFCWWIRLNLPLSIEQEYNMESKTSDLFFWRFLPNSLYITNSKLTIIHHFDK